MHTSHQTFHPSDISSFLGSHLDFNNSTLLICDNLVPSSSKFISMLASQTKSKIVFLTKPWKYTQGQLSDFESKWIHLDTTWKIFYQENGGQIIDAILSDYKSSSLMILDSWWFCAWWLVEVDHTQLNGLVELTYSWEQRHIMYGSNIVTPVFSLAESSFQTDCSFTSTVRELEKYFKSINKDFHNAKVSVVWENQSVCDIFQYLWKNKNVVFHAVTHNPDTSFHVEISNQNDFSNSDVVIFSTGGYGLISHVFNHLKSGTLVVNASLSNDSLETQNLSLYSDCPIIPLNDNFSMLHYGRRDIYLFNNGWVPVRCFECDSFRKIDLIHAEILLSMSKILSWDCLVWDMELNHISQYERWLLKQIIH